MFLKMKEKIFTLTANFSIQDELDNDKFFVRGKFLSFGHKATLMDSNENELMYIEQKVLTFLPEYHVFDENHNEIGRLKKKLTFFKPSYFITSSFGDYEIDGDVWSHAFTITKNGHICAEVSKKWLSFSDTYGIDIKDDENVPFLVAMIIAIDFIMDDAEHVSSGSSSGNN